MWNAYVERRSASLEKWFTGDQAPHPKLTLGCQPQACWTFGVKLYVRIDKAFSKMGFPCLLTTGKMALYIVENFDWYRRKAAFPPLPLLSDYKDLCPYFNLTVAEEAAQDFDLLEMTQAIFYAMVVNEALELGVVSKDLAEHLKSVCDGTCVKFGCSSTNTPLCGRNTIDRPIKEGDLDREREIGVLERGSALFFIMVFPPFLDTEEMADHVRQTFKWNLRGASCSPRPLPKEYRDLCPSFTLADAKEAARDFDIPEMIEASFYAMVVDDALELGVISRDMAGALKLALEAEGQQACPSRCAALYVSQSWSRPESAIDHEEDLGSSDVPPPASDDEASKEARSVSTSFSARGQESSSSSFHSSASRLRGGHAQKKPVPEVMVEGRSSRRLPNSQSLKTGRAPISPTPRLGYMTAIEKKSKAREMLSPFESRQATEQEIVVENKRRREEEMRRRVETQVGKAPKLASHGRKPPAVSAAPRAVGDPLVNTQGQAADFLVADSSAKYALLVNLTKSCALAPSGSAEPLKVTEQQVAITESGPPGICLGVKGRGIDPVRFSPGEANPRPPSRVLEVRKVCGQVKGQNPKLLDFIPPVTDEDDLGDEETTPLDGRAATSDGEGHEDEAHRDSNDDGDQDV
ncbi:hypothetical protein Cgig2_033848 [Carnegiea gigantea]|uniref:Uncharacterized protein n=1 Tax=Carnegiea gigantea TaxID=171969 RepID=A0A9Q1GXN0_9CARY|nr:hypothetical protein Cgig2_033848 [Carnegiea gigantea]